MASDPRLVPVTRPALWPLVRDLHADALPSAQDLMVQGLLHLPRIARADGRVPESRARAELSRIRAWRATELAPLQHYTTPPDENPRPVDMDVVRIDDLAAASVLSHFHYLRSPREDSVNVAAVYNGRIAAICCISELDLPFVEQQLPVARGEAAVISRVFAFDWAPRNTISYLLARAERYASREPGEIRMLLTYVNPNLGFTGASYKAANWLPFGCETGTRYAYLDMKYITDRRVCQLGLADRVRVEYSRMPLRPLVLLCRLLDRGLQRAHPKGFHVVVPRLPPGGVTTGC